jgi:hypothetical protein
MLFGIPMAIWGVVCLVIAVVYFLVWPKQVSGSPRPAWAHLVLRYLHSFVWLLLAATCFLGGAGAATAAQFLALLAGVCYAVFIVVYLKYGAAKRSQPRG